MNKNLNEPFRRECARRVLDWRESLKKHSWSGIEWLDAGVLSLPYEQRKWIFSWTECEAAFSLEDLDVKNVVELLDQSQGLLDGGQYQDAMVLAEKTFALISCIQRSSKSKVVALNNSGMVSLRQDLHVLINQTFLLKSRCAYGLGDFDEAIANALTASRHWRSLTPREIIECHAVAVKGFIGGGCFDEAKEAIEILVNEFPNSVNAWMIDEFAIEFARNGQTAGWVDWLSKTFRQYPDLVVYGRTRMLFVHFSKMGLLRLLISSVFVSNKNEMRNILLGKWFESNAWYKAARRYWAKVANSKECDRGTRRSAKRQAAIAKGKWTGDWTDCLVLTDKERRLTYANPSVDIRFAMALLKSRCDSNAIRLAKIDARPAEQYGILVEASEQLAYLSEECWKDIAIEALIDRDTKLCSQALENVADQRFVESVRYELIPK